jgi:hypothetical protein
MGKVFQQHRSKTTEYIPCEAESRSVSQEIPHHFYNVKDC